MLSYKIAVILAEGLILGLLGIGLYVSFEWLRFPDLTPDGSFTLGAVVYATIAMHGVNPWACLFIAAAAGGVAGLATGMLNCVARVPAIISGLLTATGLYSINWLLLGRPNQFITKDQTILGATSGETGEWSMVGYSLLIYLICASSLYVFAYTRPGLISRAIGDNPLLARDLRIPASRSTFMLLSLGNSCCSLSGALYAQRSCVADVNMGVGVTVIGLVGLLLGLLFAGGVSSRISRVLLGILCGSVVYKAIVFSALDVGFPAESFRLTTAVILMSAFWLVKRRGADIFRKVRWS